MPRRLALAAVLALLATPVDAQQALPSVAEQVAAAVLPLPAELRAGATVLGYRQPGQLVELRRGSNGMRCLALYAVREDFHVACYQDGLEPFMARGRALRVEGVEGPMVDSVRFREVAERKLKLPAYGTLYSITTQRANFNAATNTVKEAGLLAVVYIPGATPESTGLSARPRRDGPWLMFPGTPKAHIMMVGSMNP
ncbi:MAG: hypothetical protein KF709_10060 [Gemmatimonadaceae bacterium]|nr:hypothetical protein [Gemmatimonadaceae bacterium]